MIKMKWIPRISNGKGFDVSVQASSFCYSLPRNDTGPYSAVELGFPSERPPDSIMEYCENPDNPLTTVYGYVPVDLIRDWLESKGCDLAPLREANILV